MLPKTRCIRGEENRYPKKDKMFQQEIPTAFNDVDLHSSLESITVSSTQNPDMPHKKENQNDDFETKPLKAKKSEKCDFNDKSLYQKLCHLKSSITVEPILAGIIIPSMFARLAIQNLNIEKACRVKLNFGDEICDSLIARTGLNMTHYERDVQRVITSIEAWRSIISTALPMIIIIVMGAWSDRTGNRKFCILFPIFGEFMVSICNIISTYFFYEIPLEATMVLEAIFPAVTGGWVMVFMGVFSYISDITSEESRTFRVGLVNLCMTAGVPIGTALSGILLQILGYYGIFIISSSMYILTFMYGYLCLKNNTKIDAVESKEKTPFKLSDVFSLTKETAAVAFKKRDGNTRTKIILTLLVVAIVYGPSQGERLIMYMYVRYRLKWDAVKYSMYSTYSIITHSISCLFCISVFSRRLGFHDSMLTLISIISKCVGSIMLAFVQTDFMMFMVPIVELFNATTFTSLRSMASKLVPQEEMGKMNSLFSLVETLAALVFDPAYSGLYFATLPILPGAVFFFSAAMTLPSMAILVWFFVHHRQELRQRRADAAEDKNDVIHPEGNHSENKTTSEVTESNVVQ